MKHILLALIFSVFSLQAFAADQCRVKLEHLEEQLPYAIAKQQSQRIERLNKAIERVRKRCEQSQKRSEQRIHLQKNQACLYGQGPDGRCLRENKVPAAAAVITPAPTYREIPLDPNPVIDNDLIGGAAYLDRDELKEEIEELREEIQEYHEEIREYDEKIAKYRAKGRTDRIQRYMGKRSEKIRKLYVAEYRLTLLQKQLSAQ